MDSDLYQILSSWFEMCLQSCIDEKERNSLDEDYKILREALERREAQPD